VTLSRRKPEIKGETSTGGKKESSQEGTEILTGRKGIGKIKVNQKKEL